MKIYTRSGDHGQTTLAGGKKVTKTHLRIEAYGTIDELIAYAGMLRDLLEEESMKENLLEIQDRLMTCAAILAADCEDCKVRIPEIREGDILHLEQAIDRMETELPPLQSFVLPGGHPASSLCHIARTVCRRAERCIVRCSSELFVPDVVLKYVNRLSDYLFVLARYVLRVNNKVDTYWKPKL